MKKVIIEVTFENGKVREYWIDGDIDFFESLFIVGDNPYSLKCFDDKGRKANIYFNKIAAYSYEEVEVEEV